MVASEIAARILARTDDPSAITADMPEVMSLINEGQELAALLSLCLETTASVTLMAGAPFGVLLQNLPDYICPLRLSVAGARLRPGTLAEFDGDNENWQATPGVPARYSTLGWWIYAVTPQPAADTAAELIYARSPRVMVEADTPEIPEQYHQSLVSYGKYRVRLKEGAQGLVRGVADLNDFLDAITQLGDWVRARSRAARYDTLPIELALFDRSRLLVKEPKPKPGEEGGRMIDTSAVIQSILPDLHADTVSDLYFWTEADLIRWEDETVKRLARVAAVFVRRDISLVTVAGQAGYSLPARHVATLHVSLGARPLRPSNMEELEGLDPAFQTTPGPPERWYEDKLAAPKIALAPVPTAAGATLPIVYNSWPPELDAAKANTSLLAPAPVKGYLAMAVLGAAYQIEGESEMPDVAAHCRGRLELYEQAFRGYFGRGI